MLRRDCEMQGGLTSIGRHRPPSLLRFIYLSFRMSGARSARLSVPPSFLPFGADLIQACNQAYIISSYTVVRIQSTLLDSLKWGLRMGSSS